MPNGHGVFIINEYLQKKNLNIFLFLFIRLTFVGFNKALWDISENF